METPRCTRIRRRFGPKAHSLMARTLPQERYQRRHAVEASKRVRPRRGTCCFSTADYGFGRRRERRDGANGFNTETRGNGDETEKTNVCPFGAFSPFVL